jgi:hypothetical protein
MGVWRILVNDRVLSVEADDGLLEPPDLLVFPPSTDRVALLDLLVANGARP